MIAVALAAALFVATPPPDDRLVDAFKAYVEAEGIGPVILPACAAEGTHAVCYGIVGSADAMFGIAVTVDDVNAPVFVSQLMAPFGSDASAAQPDEPPSHDELESIAEELLMSPQTAEAIGEDGGMLEAECEFPDPVQQGVPYRCHITACTTWAGIDITFDSNWVPHRGDTLYF